MSSEDQTIEIVESVAPSAIEALNKSEIDSQVSTAKKYPRVLSTVKQSMLSFATLDVDTASGCFFTLPGRKGGDGKPIQGPSIRMAEIALSCYQNLRAGARIISDDGKQITAQGICHDLQNNVYVSVEVKRRVTTKDGRRYSDDMVIMTGNAACSIALRNATFRVVPLALVKPVYEAAKRTAVGDAKTLVQRRSDSMAHFAKLGVAKEKVFTALGVKSLEDIGLEHVEILIGYATAIRDGESSIDEIFDPKPEPTAKPLGEIIGKPEDKKDTKAETKTESKPETKSERTYTDAERSALLKEVESLMLDHAVGESRILIYCHEHGLAKPEQDEIGSLPTPTLDAIRSVIPTLKKGGAK